LILVVGLAGSKKSKELKKEKVIAIHPLRNTDPGITVERKAIVFGTSHPL
jgi:hypothetical protein